ncbi:Exo_endo_phos domain-containing protein [Cephalotus follicularis]|uniref:Exo_endo_phos domain-containing protein n=1 Tax=Cephalotus follicularis TaxID=3775 RepID=A0A1Q3B770_CEPFO|nr:Exo_endo_phos domain-containing protein [Cephalotus follicularis]
MRGLNHSSKQKEVRQFIMSNNISIVGILESRVRADNLDRVTRSIHKQWKSCSNHSVSLLSRIVVMWDPACIQFVPIFVNEQAIHGEVSFPNNMRIRISFIYGVCNRYERRKLWADIIHYASSFRNEPWIILGDFNVTRFGVEHSVRNGVTKAMQEFNNMIRSAELEDLKGSGMHFT